MNQSESIFEQLRGIKESAKTPAEHLSAFKEYIAGTLGEVEVTQEQIEEFLSKLVERGEIADGDARNLISDIVDWRKKSVPDGLKKAEEGYESRIERLLSRMNIPTKDEIDSLSEQIEKLSRKVDELNLKN